MRARTKATGTGREGEVMDQCEKRELQSRQREERARRRRGEVVVSDGHRGSGSDAVTSVSRESGSLRVPSLRSRRSNGVTVSRGKETKARRRRRVSRASSPAVKSKGGYRPGARRTRKGAEKEYGDGYGDDGDDDDDDDIVAGYGWADLPNEVLCRIYAATQDGEAVVVARRVCWSWCNASYDPVLWRGLCRMLSERVPGWTLPQMSGWDKWELVYKHHAWKEPLRRCNLGRCRFDLIYRSMMPSRAVWCGSEFKKALERLGVAGIPEASGVLTVWKSVYFFAPEDGAPRLGSARSNAWYLPVPGDGNGSAFDAQIRSLVDAQKIVKESEAAISARAAALAKDLSLMQITVTKDDSLEPCQCASAYGTLRDALQSRVQGYQGEISPIAGISFHVCSLYAAITGREYPIMFRWDASKEDILKLMGGCK